MQPELLKQVNDRIAAEFATLYGSEALEGPKLPQRLYHYTSAAGLLGILETGELWASSVVHLNDASELEDARSTVRSVLKESSTWKLSENMRFWISTIPVFLEQMSLDYFVICFCENGDLLSQWRAYGARGTGYSLGFGTRALGDVAARAGFAFKKVEYEPEVKQEIIRKRVAIIRQNLEAISDQLDPKDDADVRAMPPFLGRIASVFAPTLASMKHAAFAEEQEWRLILMQAASCDGDLRQGGLPVRFRVADGRLIPYVALPWRPDSGQPVESIAEVRYGPVSDAKLTERTLLDVLRVHACGEARVAGSAVPLRA